MSVRTIYKCDKCGAEQSTADQFWVVGVIAHVRNGSINTYSPFVSQDHKMEVCRKCLESFGIHVQHRGPKAPMPKPPTLEDLIIQLVQDTIDTQG